jgi:hypothetical protein
LHTPSPDLQGARGLFLGPIPGGGFEASSGKERRPDADARQARGRTRDAENGSARPAARRVRVVRAVARPAGGAHRGQRRGPAGHGPVEAGRPDPLPLRVVDPRLHGRRRRPGGSAKRSALWGAAQGGRTQAAVPFPSPRASPASALPPRGLLAPPLAGARTAVRLSRLRADPVRAFGRAASGHRAQGNRRSSASSRKSPSLCRASRAAIRPRRIFGRKPLRTSSWARLSRYGISRPT